MSFILNAIRKSEQERQTGQPETLENKIMENHEAIPKKNSNWIVILIIINVIFLSYFIWSTTKKDDKKLVKEETSAVPAELTSAVSAVSAEQEVQNENKKKTPLPADVSELIKERRASIAERIKQIQSKYKTNNNTVPVRSVSSKQKLKPKVTTAIVERPETLSSFDKAGSDEQKEKQDEPPFLSELNYDFRRRTPDIDINVFVYAEKEENRFIMLNMTKYVTGQEINTGMKLKEIRMNSIVVEYRDKEFQLKR